MEGRELRELRQLRLEKICTSVQSTFNRAKVASAQTRVGLLIGRKVNYPTTRHRGDTFLRGKPKIR